MPIPLRPARFLLSPAAIALALFAGGCAGNEPPAPRAIVATTTKPPAPSGDYSRLLRTGEDDYTLELAVRTFRPVSGDGPAVTLVPAIHIGTKKYYRELQYILDTRDLVLFEGVSEDPDAFKKPFSKEKAEAHLYAKIAKALGLVTQLGAIDYKREKFVNADMSMTAIRAKLELEAKEPGETGASARMALRNLEILDSLLSGDGLLGPVLGALFSLAGDNPQFRAQMLLTLAEGEKTAAKESKTGGMGRLMAMIVDDRNAEAMRRLDQTLATPEPPATIAVFYGAAHLRGMEKILVGTMGYRLAGTEWITAYVVHPAAAGLSGETLKKLTAGAVGR